MSHAPHEDSPSMFGSTLPRHRAFWSMESSDRPVVACNVGYLVNQCYPHVMDLIPDGPAAPDDISIEAVLEDMEHLYQAHLELDIDCPFTGSPFNYIPWMEAIMGCPVKASRTAFWAERCVENWGDWHWQRPGLDNPWMRKLLELMNAVVAHASGRFPVSHALMRGPADVIAAMCGAANLPLNMYDHPDVIRRVGEIIADVYVEVGKAQLALIPDCAQGYMARGDGLRCWAPDRFLWLQEDAAALLSPKLYGEFILPLDRRIAASFPCTAFHLHASSAWVIDYLVEVPEIDVIQLNLDIGETAIDEFFRAWQRVSGRKRLVVARMFEEGIWSWLDRMTREFPPNGLTVVVTTESLAQAKEWMEGFRRITAKSVQIAVARSGVDL